MVDGECCCICLVVLMGKVVVCLIEFFGKVLW